jgi:Fe-S-cluster-containing hydrogenase component 2
MMREEHTYTRRTFLGTALGGSAVLLLGQFGVLRLVKAQGAPIYKMIVVDYTKCTGCRTCETACAAYNQKQTVGGETLSGLGNPYYANIRVYNYNPDLDVPSVCAMCPDNPCIEACPIDPDPATGRKALYRDETTLTVKNDLERCIGCGNCAEVCRTGVIIPNPETNQPERMCTLCDGDPQCVKECPFEALSYVDVRMQREFYGMKPDQIAEELIKRWYQGTEV